MVDRNVVCVTVDGLQAGMLGPYGNAWIRTPSVNRLAAQSFVFDQAFVCEPSLDALLQVLWPGGIFDCCPATLLTDDAVVNAHPSSAVFQNKQLRSPSEQPATVDEIENTELGLLLGNAVKWLGHDSEPFCLWIHSRGMVGSWDAPYESRAQYADEEDPPPPVLVAPPDRLLQANFDPDEVLGIQQAYAGQVSAFDACLGALMTALDELTCANNTLFILIGARGFPLGEHLKIGLRDAPLYNELIHVPFIVRFPDRLGALNRSQAIVTHADLPNLIADWLGHEKFSSQSDLCLSSLARREQIPWRDHLLFRSRDECAIRTPAWFLRERGSHENIQRELYVKPDDRHEVNDIADRCPDIASALADALSKPDGGPNKPLSESLVTSID